MKRAAFLAGLLSASMLGAALVLACADSEPMSPAGDGGEEASADAAPGDAAGDARSEPPRCGASQICLRPAPIDQRINLTSIWGSSATDIWAVGTDATVLHYDGASWEKARPLPQDASSPFTLKAVWLERADDVWILDGNRIRHASGWKGPDATEWSFFGSAVSDELMPTALRGAGGAVWLARRPWGRLEGPTLERLGPWGEGGPGATDRLENPPNTTLTALSAASADELWAVGNSKVMRVSRPLGDAGTGWQIEDHDTRANTLLLGIWADHEGVWVVGESGTLRHMAASAVPTKTFAIVPSPVKADLYGVFGFGPDDVWAVGEASTVLHWDGARWSTLSTPFDDMNDKPRLLSVWGSSPEDVWIVGNGVILHYPENAP